MPAEDSVMNGQLSKTLDVAIVGSGFAGLGMAIQLRRKGVNNFVVLEKADSVGGVWRDNRYPGCACDVPSHLYSYSFEPNPQWSRSYSPQGEIENYLQHCAQKYEVLPNIRFGSHLVRADFDEHAACWRLHVADSVELKHYMIRHGLKLGDRLDIDAPEFPTLTVIRARVLISGMGGLSAPALPDIRGMSEFRGKIFHSQDWPKDYSIIGKRVAVVGTGASAIQLVPQLQRYAERVDLYQRTPAWILPKHDHSVSGFKRRLFAMLPFTQRLMRSIIYWQAEALVVGFLGGKVLMKLAEMGARKHLYRQVPDPQLRHALMPNYRIGCKRVLISNEYYPSLGRPNVSLITEGIDQLSERGIVDRNGVLREVDAVVFSTGFQATSFVPPGAIVGLGGKELSAYWKGGAEAYKGSTVSGFPNFFMLVGPNVTLGHNSMIFMIEAQIDYVLDALDQMSKHGIDAVDIKSSVQTQYNEALQKDMKSTVWSTGGCKSWYMDDNGKNVTLWSGSSWRFRRITQRFDIENYRRYSSPIVARARDTGTEDQLIEQEYT